MDESDDKIIDIYRGLWKIEESFRVTKSDLEARPVFVSTKEHIEGHFLSCFLSLTIARILEMKTQYKYSITKLLDSISKSTCTYIGENLYLFTYYDDVLNSIGEVFNIPFNHKVLSLKEIKKILGDTKKQ